MQISLFFSVRDVTLAMRKWQCSMWQCSLDFNSAYLRSSGTYTMRAWGTPPCLSRTRFCSLSDGPFKLKACLTGRTTCNFPLYLCYRLDSSACWRTLLLRFVMFVPVVSLMTLRVICFICIYVMNYLGDVLRVML